MIVFSSLSGKKGVRSILSNTVLVHNRKMYGMEVGQRGGKINQTTYKWNFNVMRFVPMVLDLNVKSINGEYLITFRDGR